MNLRISNLCVADTTARKGVNKKARSWLTEPLVSSNLCLRSRDWRFKLLSIQPCILKFNLHISFSPSSGLNVNLSRFDPGCNKPLERDYASGLCLFSDRGHSVDRETCNARSAQLCGPITQGNVLARILNLIDLG